MITASEILRKLYLYERHKDIFLYLLGTVESWCLHLGLQHTLSSVHGLRHGLRFFFIQISLFSSMGIEHTLYSASNCFDTLVKDHFTMYFKSLYLVYLWALNCFLLIYLSIFMSIIHSLNHYGFMVFIADIEKYILFFVY